MITVHEGEKKDIALKCERTRGTGGVTMTDPERRILDASRTLVAGYDWAAASWDDVADELYCLFDSTAAALSAVGLYYVQLRGTIGNERYAGEIAVEVVNLGP